MTAGVRLAAAFLALAAALVAADGGAQIVVGSITGGAGGGGGGGSFSGGTVTSTIEFNGVDPDVSTGTDEDFTVEDNGTGRMVVERSVVVDDQPGFFVGGTTFGQDSLRGGYVGNGYGYFATGVGDSAQLGVIINYPHNAMVACVTDNVSFPASYDRLQCVYGEGMRVVERQHAITIADDGAGTSPSSTAAPESEHVEIDCQDSDGCSWAPADTGADGSTMCAVVVSSSTVTVSDAAGVIAVPGSSVVLGARDALCLVRSQGIWVTTSYSDN